jgi:hypothetical protein
MGDFLFELFGTSGPVDSRTAAVPPLAAIGKFLELRLAIDIGDLSCLVEKDPSLLGYGGDLSRRLKFLAQVYLYGQSSK